MHRITASTTVLEEQKLTELPKSTNSDAIVIKGGSSTGKPFDYGVFPDPYLMVDQQNKQNIAIDYIGTKKSFLITDDLLNYTWEITSQTKKIKSIHVIRQLQLLEVIVTKRGLHPTFR